ncbi:xylulokinase [Ahrensia sp. R2A130]|uniref:xylulokinase n=1 Tax=Ahrensia sp. R2A130 TaxID=744979 RepID=UPI0001E09C6B|nr:xylulokinase [Ahrensia sp. R2A130]EFL88598.1 xylulokinase [Ahrensia sp. R2A130]
MYLALDIGTSGLKALLVDDGQAIVAETTAPLSVQRPHAGWSEQNPADWIVACETVLDSLKASHPGGLSAVRAIGLSGQMHGATLLGERDEVLRPCMLWNDTRSHAQAAKLDADPCFRAISGNIVFPGFTAPKLQWMRENEPEIFARTKRVLLPKDYLRLWLSGEAMSDMSDAAGTGWLDVAKREWSPDLLAATGFDISHMPILAEGSEAAGRMRPELASRWGMKSCIIAGGAGDNAASAIGLGAVSGGQGFVSLGTSGVLFAATDSYLPKPQSAVHAFCHAVPDTWHQMGVFLSATDSLNWWAGVAGADVATLVAEAEAAPTADTPTFLPYLAGERTPHNDASIRGGFIDLDHAHDRAAMTNAVLSGVAFALRDSLDALTAAGTLLESVLAVGGGTRSDHWLQIIADALDIPVELPASGELGAAFGAARLAMMADGAGAPETIATTPAVAKRFEPKSDMSAQLSRYRALYPALKGITP